MWASACKCCKMVGFGDGRVDFNTQKVMSKGELANGEEDARAERLKEAVASIFAVSGETDDETLYWVCILQNYMCFCFSLGRGDKYWSALTTSSMAPGHPDTCVLVPPAATAFNFSAYTPIMFLFPFTAPLARRLAAYYPDAGIQRFRDARHTIVDTVSDLIQQHRRALAAEARTQPFTTIGQTGGMP